MYWLGLIISPALANGLLGLAVVLLLLWVVNRLLRERRKGQGGCSACGGCSVGHCPAARAQTSAKKAKDA